MLSWKKIPPLARIPLAWGVLGAFIAVGFVVLFFQFGKHPFFIPPFFDVRILIMAIFLYFALREVRDYFFGGLLFLWQGMGGCLVFLGVMSTLCWAGIYLYASMFPAFVTTYVSQGLEQISKFSPTDVKQVGEAAVEEIRVNLAASTAATMATKYAGQNLMMGFFVTIIISVILRRQPQTL